MPDSPLLLERHTAEWSITYDLSHAPNYLGLTLRGKATPDRTQALIDLMQDHSSSLTNAQGRIFPLIIDLRHEGPISMDGLKMAWSITTRFGSRLTLVFVVIDAHRPDTARLRSHVSTIARLVPQLIVVNSLEEALPRVAQHRSA